MTNKEEIQRIKSIFQKDGFVSMLKGRFWRLKSDSFELTLVDQGIDGVEVLLVTGEEFIRLDYLLEFYLTNKLDLVNKYLRDQKEPVKFYQHFVASHNHELKSISQNAKGYLLWEKNLTKTDFEDIRSYLR